MNSFWTLLKRALLLRCPNCGKGKLFRRWFTMYEHCPVCHFLYEREEGFFTGATAINLVAAEFVVVIFIVPVAIWAGTNPDVPYIPLLLLGAPLPILLPVFFFRHSRALWLSMSYWLDPPQKEE